MADRLLGALGLAYKAGQVVSGAELGLKLVREGKAGLVLLDAGASANTRKKIQDACKYRGIQVILMDAGLLGAACGRPGMAVGAVKSGGFAGQMIRQAAAPGGADTEKETMLEDMG